LHRGNELIKLEPKAFDLLLFLVQHRDRVVGKDDLRQAVWDGRVVSESAVNTRLNAVRRALADNGTMQRLIRTFPRKGLRFVGEVTKLPDQRLPETGEAPTSAPETDDRPSIAVVPFRNMTSDRDQEYFVDGMAEEITTALTRLPWLDVIACNP